MTVHLGGIIPALITPFTEGGAPDLNSVENLAENLISAGANGLLLFDRNSESDRLSLPEMQVIVSTVTRQAAGRIPVIVSLKSAEPAQAVHLAGKGAVAAFMAPPPRPHPPESQLKITLFRTIKHAAQVPVILDYTFPPGISPLEAAEADGLLDSLDEIDMVRVNQPPAGPLISALRSRSSGLTSTIAGLSGLHIVDALDRGAAGATTLCCIPEPFCNIVKYREHGSHSEATKAYEELLPLISLINQTPAMATACEKIILCRRGWINSDVRRDSSYSPDAKQRSDLFTLYEGLAKKLQLV